MTKDELTHRVGPRRLSWPRIARTAAVALVAALTSIITLSAPAHADINPGDYARVANICPPSYFCVFQDANYWGKWIRQLRGHPRPNVGDFLNDQISSLWNRTGNLECVYQDAFYSGAWRELLPNESHHDLKNDRFNHPTNHEGDPNMNDQISSWRGC